jgi:RNA polymerase sigma-70 factor (ECF subfamily)
METLEVLVRRARDGDVAAFGEIVGRLSRRAVATAHLITGDLHLGEEAAQDAFVAAWRRIGTLRDPVAFRGWFGTILARTASRARSRLHAPLDSVLEPAAQDPGLAEPESLPREAARLKPIYRQVLALRYVEGLSYREIATALGVSVARVKSRLHDGRQLLRERLERGRRGRS